jgi:hypothetical protein
MDKLKDDILYNMEKEFNAAHIKKNIQAKNSVIFFMQSLLTELQATDRKGLSYYLALFCAGWIKSTDEEKPDPDLTPSPKLRKQIREDGKVFVTPN